MAGNLKGVAEEGEDRSGEEEASATTYFFSPDSCPTIGEAPPNSDQTKVRKSVKFKKRKSIKEIVAHRRKKRRHKHLFPYFYSFMGGTVNLLISILYSSPIGLEFKGPMGP